MKSIQSLKLTTELKYVCIFSYKRLNENKMNSTKQFINLYFRYQQKSVASSINRCISAIHITCYILMCQ